MKKYYAVLRGRGKTPAIYNSWEECREKIEGYSDAKFKGFKEFSCAKEYINANSQEDNKIPGIKNKLIAYVDGSYSVRKDNYAYGVVLLKNGEIIKTMSDK
ncbi:MAG: viroplasmin family protein, partial [Nanoarchaeota archaeon]